MFQKFLLVFFLFFTSCHAETLNQQVIPIFHKYQALNAEYLDSNNSNYKESLKKVETYMYHEYTDALKLLEQNYCSHPDKTLLHEFVLVLIANSNSTYEYPHYVLGELYICQPELVIEQINSLNPKEKKYMFNSLYWGFKNVTYEKENEIKNFTELSDKLDGLKAQ